ncbi:ABC transporter substrate-binding protein [Halopseudomonas nanhaiensis]|uniref:ABC transporter substrate-binding protein n=1 Tax=Halopseudomonas nanhaiensis TaxID=2830842 RepID=UPI001CBFC1CF|nr:ABC transporter substrate-binding protein [Halopseudomonas nanhaiensis]UAW98437.1 ABC transporter substrate-binding protein [Halopseudomonas nanhaiensis]
MRRRAFLLGCLLIASLTVARAEPLVASRVAVIDWGLAETLLGLGMTPLAVAELDNYRRWVAIPEMPAGVQDLGLRTEPNLELLAQLRPDLILITPQFEAARPKLERIAPVVSLSIYRPNGDPYANAQQVTREIAALTALEPNAEALIASVDAQLDALREALADQTIPPLFVASLMDDRHARVFGRQSLFHAVMQRAGLTNAWSGSDNFWGFAQTGIEQLADPAEAGLILLQPLPLNAERSLASSALWQNLPLVRAERVYRFPPTWQFGGLVSASRFASLLDEALDE